jgi:hypothetical protein
VNLPGQRLVAGRQALDRIADPAVEKAQPVSGGYGFRARGESMGVQRPIQEDTGMVAGKGSAGAIRAVQARGQPDYEQSVARAPEGRHRAAVILRVTPAHAIQKAREPRAEPAIRVERRAPAAHGGVLSVP